jgi:8-oxo-dGTP diphosphatase
MTIGARRISEGVLVESFRRIGGSAVGRASASFDDIAYYCANSAILGRGADMTDGKWHDSDGRALDDFKRPAVAVDTAVLSLDHRLGLVVLEVRRTAGRGWALPGTFLHVGETLADAVDRSLRVKANVRGLCPRQLHVFDALDRDERGWVLSVAHVDVVRLDQLGSRFAKTTRLVPVEAPGLLPFDHPDIIDLAVERIRSDYEARPDPDWLLVEEFTLRELLLAHQAIAGDRLQRDAFRRAMERHLEPTGKTTTGTRGRPAELFRRCDTGE